MFIIMVEDYKNPKVFIGIGLPEKIASRLLSQQ
jgi:hypothetical protein